MNTTNTMVNSNPKNFTFNNFSIDHITYVSFNIILITFGIFGSISIFVTICITKELKSTTSIIIATIAAADLMVSISGISSLIGKKRIR